MPVRLRQGAGVLAALLLLLASAARADDDPDTEVARRLFKEAGELYVAGQYERALAQFEKARQAKPLPAFDFNIGRCDDRLGRWADALAAYERYVGVATDASDVREATERIGVLRLRVKAAADRAVADEHYRKAVLEYNAGRYGSAGAEFELAHRALPDAAMLYNIAQAYRLAGDARARGFYESYLREVPASPLRATVEVRLAELHAAPAGHAPQAPPSSTVPNQVKPAATPAAAMEGASARLHPVAELIKANRASFRACFDRWSAAHAGLGGKVMLTFYLDPDGAPTQTRAETAGFDAPEVSRCIVEAAQKMSYPPSTSGKFTRITYPFDFKP